MLNVVDYEYITVRGLVSFRHSLDGLGRRGDMRDDSAEKIFQSFLWDALILARAGMSTR